MIYISGVNTENFISVMKKLKKKGCIDRVTANNFCKNGINKE